MKSVAPFVVSYATRKYKIICHCLSALDTKYKGKGEIQVILRDSGVEGDTVVLTRDDGAMMKLWLIDLFARKIQSENYDICAIIGTSAVNCGISSNDLYYIFVKGHPRSFLELI